MIIDEFQMKVIESKLSPRCHLVERNGERLVLFDGYLLDYATFCTMVIWVLSGSTTYMNLVTLRSAAKLKNMNNMEQDNIVYILYDKFQKFLNPANNKSEANKHEIKEMIIGIYE